MSSGKALKMISSIAKLKKHSPYMFAGLTLVLCATYTGCYRRQEFKAAKVSPKVMYEYLADKPENLKPYYQRVLTEGNRNKVLNNMRVGVCAMETGYYDCAEEALEKALLGIEAVYADNDTAAKARSLYYEEGMKDFKGEPYERCMAYYYRGLLYLQKGDYENARACFKTGVLQDAFAEEKQGRCDFALLIFLQGWASQQLGDEEMASTAYEEVKRYRPDFKKPSPEDNVLIIAETGTSPRKVADGAGHSELKFRRGRNFRENRVEVIVNGSEKIALYPIEDIAWQAMTRGGRAIDKILQGQVEFRKSKEQMGTILTDISSNAMISAPLWGDNAEVVQGVSAALGLVGVMQMADAAKARPHADTRYWDNLPDGVHIATMAKQAGPLKVQIHFKDATEAILPELSKEKVLNVTGGGTSLLWIRSRKTSLSKLQ